MFWQRLGWPESKPAVKKFWAIRTKLGDDHSFQGKQLHVRATLSEWIAIWMIWQSYQRRVGAEQKTPNFERRRPSILGRIAQNFFAAGFDYRQRSRCQNIFQLNLYKLPKSLFISFRKMVRNVFWTAYNYAQFHCLNLDLWLANSKICLKLLSGWPRFVCSHCKS